MRGVVVMVALACFAAVCGLAQTVVLDPKVGTDTRLGIDPPQLPAGRRAQAEPHVARSLNDPLLLLAVFQEGRFEGPGAFDCGYAISADGGLTWRRSVVSNLVAALDGGPFMAASDPVAGVDRHDNLYLNILGLKSVDPSIQTTVVLCKSTDRGATFSPPLTVYSAPDSSSFADKNWLTINTFAGSPHVDRLVVTFGLFTPRDFRIASTYSDDGGTNWSAIHFISPSACLGSQPLFLPDGSLAVLFWNVASNQIQIVNSPDGGATFGNPQPVASAVTVPDSIARDVSLLLSAATDRQAGVIYVAYKAWVDWPRILFTRSIDQGKTWSPPVPISDNPRNVSVFDPALAVSPDGQHLTVIFYDKRNDTGQGKLVDLYLAESFDGGKTWAANLRLTDVSSDLTLAPLTSQGRMLGDYQGIVPALNFDSPAVAVWIDTRTGSPDPFSLRIKRTQGATFAAWRALRFSADELNNANVSAEGAAPAGDGVPNLVKYVFGIEPNLIWRGPLSSAGVATTPSPSLNLAYTPLAVLSDIQFSWRSSPDLLTWSPAIPDRQIASSGANPFTQRVDSTFVIRPENRRFFRLGVARINISP